MVLCITIKIITLEKFEFFIHPLFMFHEVMHANVDRNVYITKISYPKLMIPHKSNFTFKIENRKKKFCVAAENDQTKTNQTWKLNATLSKQILN